jgi:hypothetical protein
MRGEFCIRNKGLWLHTKTWKSPVCSSSIVSNLISVSQLDKDRRSVSFREGRDSIVKKSNPDVEEILGTIFRGKYVCEIKVRKLEKVQTSQQDTVERRR